MKNIFQDFDSPAVLQDLITRCWAPATRNFVLNFDLARADCAFDLNLSELQSTIEGRSKVSAKKMLDMDKDIIDYLARHYGFSTRLRLSMQADPKPRGTPRADVPAAHSHSSYRKATQLGRLHGTSSEPVAGSEKVNVSGSDRHGAALSDLNHYRVADDLWHFTSVDWGTRYTSIGYNTVLDLKALPEPLAETEQYDKPAGTRFWTWLVLCDDGTVISIYENLFPAGQPVDLPQLRLGRRNLVNVFRQISKASGSEPSAAIKTVQVRQKDDAAHSEDDTHISEIDSPSLLLYYLFDDWYYNNYSLVSRAADQFGPTLDRVRSGMFAHAQLSHVHMLHRLGQQLSILKRMYQSYGLIVDRVLQGPREPPQLSQSSRSPNSGDAAAGAAGSLEEPSTRSLGVALTAPAAFRFERLKDRIEHLALSEIQACIDEKNSLMALNFNLITIRESSYIEKLTRITILLAKATILFLPVSVMTAYFSVPFGQTFEVPTYWIAFAVILVLSFLLLVVFGLLSGTIESRPIYTSMTRALVALTQSWWHRSHRESLS